MRGKCRPRGARGLGPPQPSHQGAAGRGPGRAGACEDSPAGRWEVEPAEVSSRSATPSRRRAGGGPRRPRCPPGSPAAQGGERWTVAAAAPRPARSGGAAGPERRARPRSLRNRARRAAPRPTRAPVWAPSFRASLSIGIWSSRGPVELPLPCRRSVRCRGSRPQSSSRGAPGP